ncbi:hypothetical protein IFT84_05460 [Rhizobium sp. CFBP 8762]|uniref:hypothetical protein n=1 Tax=Rhizobium sp. CFBP 8762 TaxID=2775279 RepID=UPI00177BFCB7|nr:hypothetical protein [Rhizobium sp. CFBP 8762]MBD8553966.1 hypothetical protein [Rhizobium sp. CFBP 8762]
MPTTICEESAAISRGHDIDINDTNKALCSEKQKACRGRRCGRLLKLDQQLGGGSLLIWYQRRWEEECAVDNLEDQREEVHHFDDLNINQNC